MKKMIAVKFKGNSKISIENIKRPVPADKEVILEVKASAICGTDKENLTGPGQTAVPGHEFSGVVIETGKVNNLKVGDRVAVNCHITCGVCEHCKKGDLYFCRQLEVLGFDVDGGFAEYVRVPEDCCMNLPDDITFNTGALIVDMLGTPYRAFKKSFEFADRKILIWGAGPIGLGMLIIARAYGIKAAVIDLNEFRLDLAGKLGADIVVNPKSQNVENEIKKWASGRRLKLAFDCIGNNEVVNKSIKILDERGKVVIVGVSHNLVLNPWEDLICKEISIIGTRNFNLFEYDEITDLTRSVKSIESIITHTYPIDKAEEAFDTFLRGKCGKILFKKD